MCPNTEFFLVRIFPHSDWIRRDKKYLSIFSPNAGKYRPEKTPYLDTFHAVGVFPSNYPWWTDRSLEYLSFDHLLKCYFTAEKPYQKWVLLELKMIFLLRSKIRSSFSEVFLYSNFLLQICRIFSEHFFIRTPLESCFCKI